MARPGVRGNIWRRLRPLMASGNGVRHLGRVRRKTSMAWRPALAARLLAFARFMARISVAHGGRVGVMVYRRKRRRRARNGGVARVRAQLAR